MKGSQTRPISVIDIGIPAFDATKRITESLRIIHCGKIHFFVIAIGETDLIPMLECFVCIGLFVLKLYLLGITGDEPEFQLVVTTSKIIVVEFETVIQSGQTEILFHPLLQI